MNEPTTANVSKKRLYVDMDNVLTDFSAALKMRSQETLEQYKGSEDEIPGLFAQMPPIPGAIEAMKVLANHYDIYILSTAPWGNPSAWSDKLEWVKKYLDFTLPGKKDPYFKKRLIISHNKDFNKGDYLIDDRPKNGAKKFEGEWLRFKGQKDDKEESDQRIFNDWHEVITYLAEKDHMPIDIDNLELIHENLSTTATSEDLERAITDEFGVKYSDDGRRLLSAFDFRKQEYRIPDCVKVICDEAFLSCPDLRYLAIPESVIAIGLDIFPYNGLERIECASEGFEIDDSVLYPKGKNQNPRIT